MSMRIGGSGWRRNGTLPSSTTTRVNHVEMFLLGGFGGLQSPLVIW